MCSGGRCTRSPRAAAAPHAAPARESACAASKPRCGRGRRPAPQRQRQPFGCEGCLARPSAPDEYASPAGAASGSPASRPRLWSARRRRQRPAAPEKRWDAIRSLGTQVCPLDQRRACQPTLQSPGGHSNSCRGRACLRPQPVPSHRERSVLPGWRVGTQCSPVRRSWRQRRHQTRPATTCRQSRAQS